MHNCLKLAEVMTIAAKYLKEDDFPTHCEHDVMLLYVKPSEVSNEDYARIEELGFFACNVYDCFKSHKFGSA